MKGSLDSREIEDIGGSDTLSYSEVTALATGDMRILAKAKADADVVRFARLESSWRRSQRHLKESIGQNERQVTYLQEEIAALRRPSPGARTREETPSTASSAAR